jgi:DNA-binding CsgD family transcriptional regulator
MTLLALAELWVAGGDPQRARIMLEEARTLCARLGATPALARADALAARLDAATPAAPAYPAGLSAREVEVLRLVAQGMTNPQVAERLYLSPRTVEQHLRSIYNKLGEYARYYNHVRPHQGLAQQIPDPPPTETTPIRLHGGVRAVPILGGLHHAYARAA